DRADRDARSGAYRATHPAGRGTHLISRMPRRSGHPGHTTPALKPPVAAGSPPLGSNTHQGPALTAHRSTVAGRRPVVQRPCSPGAALAALAGVAIGAAGTQAVADISFTAAFLGTAVSVDNRVFELERPL